GSQRDPSAASDSRIRQPPGHESILATVDARFLVTAARPARRRSRIEAPPALQHEPNRIEPSERDEDLVAVGLVAHVDDELEAVVAARRAVAHAREGVRGGPDDARHGAAQRGLVRADHAVGPGAGIVDLGPAIAEGLHASSLPRPDPLAA